MAMMAKMTDTIPETKPVMPRASMMILLRNLTLSCADCAAFRAGPNERCVMRVLKGLKMEIERADPDRIEVLGGKPGDKERYIESDFRIRSGLCPNGHGLMTMGGWGQECPTCGFTCNTMPDTPNGADA